MFVCVTSEGKDLGAAVDPRFGRCRNFIFVDTDSLVFEAVENPSLTASGGAGVQSGQFMAARKVVAVLTGRIGPNALHVLSSAGIKVYTGITGTVKEVVGEFKKGAYKLPDSPGVGSKSGMPNE